jgi:hypothetical protein
LYAHQTFKNHRYGAPGQPALLEYWVRQVCSTQSLLGHQGAIEPHGKQYPETAGIKTEDLPLTFQDAIWLSHELGIQFLWIDSLCIVQDDPNDWAYEAATTDSVYRNSFVTIAASRAAGTSDGFLGDRTEGPYVSVHFTRQGTTGEVLAFSLPPSLVSQPGRSVWMEQEPLSNRGWALQERYLSQRTLHFTSSQVIFECEKRCLAENMDRDHSYHSLSSTLSENRFRKPGVPVRYREWYELATMYSMRKLSVADDKLPALSGLAATYSRQRSIGTDPAHVSGQYLAGLWFDDIIRGLCWKSRGGGVRPSKYWTPS